VDFGCGLPGSIFVLTGDVLAFPKQKNAEDTRGQKLLAKVAMAQQTQLDFNVKKGSIPPRTDVPVVGNPQFDECTQIAAKIYNKSVDVVGNSALLISADEMGSVVDLVSEYFNSPDMTTDATMERFAAILTKGK
jgi:glucose/mannose transport system substrate-binding protein